MDQNEYQIGSHERMRMLYHPTPNRLDGLIGVHILCGGWVHRIQISEEHAVVICKKCLLRTTIPAEIASYEALNAYCLEHLVLPFRPRTV